MVNIMCRSVPGIFGNQQVTYLDLIKQMLQQAVLDMANYEVMYLIYIKFLFNLMGGRYLNFAELRLFDTFFPKRKHTCLLMTVISKVLIYRQIRGVHFTYNIPFY